MGNIVYKEMTDEALLELSYKGDKNAEETILIRYKNFVRSKARTYFLVGADNDDIVQEGMIGLYKAMRDYNPQKNIKFKTFAEVCIIRQIITAVKTATRNKHTPLNTYISLDKPVNQLDNNSTLADMLSIETASDPESIILVNEAVNEIEKEMESSLSSFEKSVISLYLDGYSYTYISQKLSKSDKSIDNALQRVKKKIAKYIAKK